jgi:hypothetical protein
MRRRTLVRALAASPFVASSLSAALRPRAEAAIPKQKIARVRAGVGKSGDSVYSGPALKEPIKGGESGAEYLPEAYDFKNGKLWPSRRPGLGITLDPKPLKLLAEVTERPPGNAPWIPRNKLLRRPDGSFTNW